MSQVIIDRRGISHDALIQSVEFRLNTDNTWSLFINDVKVKKFRSLSDGWSILKRYIVRSLQGYEEFPGYGKVDFTVPALYNKYIENLREIRLALNILKKEKSRIDKGEVKLRDLVEKRLKELNELKTEQSKDLLSLMRRNNGIK